MAAAATLVRVLRLGCLLALAAAPLWAAAAGTPTRLECPADLAVAQQAGGLAPGWAAADLAVASRHRLLAAGVSEGPPQDLHTIKPERIDGHPGRGRVVQRFRWSGPPRGAVHLLCHYVGTTVVVFRPVASDPQRCALETVQGPQGMAPAVLICD